MNKLKKELRRKGIKLNCDYDVLPYPIKGKSPFNPGYISIEDVTVNSEKAEVFVCYNTISSRISLNRDGSLTETWED